MSGVSENHASPEAGSFPAWRRPAVIYTTGGALLAGVTELAIVYHLILPPNPIFVAWVDVLGKLGPMLIAALVGLVGWRQYRSSLLQTDRAHALQRQQLRFFLFDRRYAIYQRFRAVQGQLSQEAEASQTAAFEATVLSEEARFLFDPATVAFLGRFQNLVWEMHSWQFEHTAAVQEKNQSQADRVLDRYGEMRKQLSASYKEADVLFRAAMGVADDLGR